MNRIMKLRSFAAKARLSLLAALLATATLMTATSWGQVPARFIGAITGISGTTLTVKTDAGQSYAVEVPTAAAIKRIAPGEKDLTKAVTMQFSELAVGDRTLVKLDPDAPAGTTQALQIIAVKQADVAQKQQQDREDWQKRGLGGLVKSVDAGAGVIVLTSGTGAAAKTITVHTTKATMLKRYAPASVSFDAALPAPIDAIHPSDQLRARGAKSADGTSIDAEEVVSGTFRNISGTITATDPAASTLVVKDLATKKQVTIHITPDAQMRRLPERMATMLAARLKGTSGGAALRSNGGAQQASGGAGSTPPAGGQGGGQAGGGQWAGQGGGQGGGGGDPQQMLNRAPAIQIADLKKGDAVMVVATDGASDVTAITLVAGVEPLLEAPAASQSLLNNWSMGGGAGAADAAAQ
ncbi:MAG TPA: hypothetical protein VMQ56_15905 [Terracidiphilus sp.]|jgi:hypothetical protein|nr:hypothetical protein [Terracidiphilus sp.]